MDNFTAWDGELRHFGIPGMKWGVRRYQNEDGSLTPAGLRRKRVRDMTDDELRAQVNRLKLEDEYRKLNKGALGRAIDNYRSYRNEKAQWDKNKASLMAAKTARANRPLRKALENIPAKLLNRASDTVDSALKTAGDELVSSIGSGIKKGKSAIASGAKKGWANRKAYGKKVWNAGMKVADAMDEATYKAYWAYQDDKRARKRVSEQRYSQHLMRRN